MINFVSGKPHILWHFIKDETFFFLKIWNINFKKKTNKTKIDDKIIGEKSNFIIKLEPIIDIIKSIKTNSKKKNPKIVCFSPQGKKISQNLIKQLNSEKEIIFISGKNRGLDNRIIKNFASSEISLGDYILNCGEIAFLILINTLNRIKKGYNNFSCIKKNSFEKIIFDYPLYSKPLKIENFEIPYIFKNNCYKRFLNWQKKCSLLKANLYRPDLKNGSKYEESNS